MRLNVEDPGDRDAGGVLSFGGGHTGGHLKNNPAEMAVGTTKLAMDVGARPAKLRAVKSQLLQNRVGDSIMFPAGLNRKIKSHSYATTIVTGSWTAGLGKALSSVTVFTESPQPQPQPQPVHVRVVRPIVHPVVQQVVHPIVRPIIRPIAIHVNAATPPPTMVPTKLMTIHVVAVTPIPSVTPSAVPTPVPTFMLDDGEVGAMRYTDTLELHLN